MTPDDLKWREARRENAAIAICAAIVSYCGSRIAGTPARAVELADELIAALDVRAREERAANDAS
jgi:hypothetical protein